MKTFIKLFITLTIGIMLGYAWAYHHYVPHIKAHKTALATYQDYFLPNLQEPSFINGLPNKNNRKTITKPND